MDNPQSTIDLAYEALEHLRALVPEGWSWAHVQQLPVGLPNPGLQVSSVRLRPGPGTPVPWPNALGLDADVRRRHLSRSLAELQESLRSIRYIWDGLNMQFRREHGVGADQPVDVVFQTPHGDPVAAIVLEAPAEVLVLDDLLVETAIEALTGFEAPPATLSSLFADGLKWRFEPETGTLSWKTPEGVCQRSATLLGSFAQAAGRWTWGFAADLGGGTGSNDALRAAMEGAELNALGRDHIDCELGLAHALAAIAGARMNARAVFSPKLDHGAIPFFGIETRA